MSVSADYLLDRRRLSRQVTFWRAAAFVVAALAILGLGLRYAGLGSGRDDIAKLRITGLITGDDRTIAALRAIGKSNAPSADPRHRQPRRHDGRRRTAL